MKMYRISGIGELSISSKKKKKNIPRKMSKAKQKTDAISYMLVQW